MRKTNYKGRHTSNYCKMVVLNESYESTVTPGAGYEIAKGFRDPSKQIIAIWYLRSIRSDDDYSDLSRVIKF
jgi:hypothetical protein